MDDHEEFLATGTVLIAGGGPVGMLFAKVLSHFNVESVLLERNKTTTSWPKMDLTNARSMEIFRRLGLTDGIRKLGVPAHCECNVLISSGLSRDEPITQWDLPSVDQHRQQILANNDGSQPLEAWQRISQVIFEGVLKESCDDDPLIDVRFGWKIDSVAEEEHHVRSRVTNVDTGNSITIVSDYLAGCDGASSRTRKSLEFPLDGGPIPACVLLVHFRSTDLARLHKQGKFWHIFLLGAGGGLGGAIIAQNEIDIWTTHLFLPVDADTETIPPEEAVYRVLGGLYEQYPIKIDEILVRSVWRPNIAIARTWTSPHGRVSIAGDAAHQNIPTGGYGMNMGIGDAYDLGWKLAAVINGYAGQGLLRSYEEERRPVALRNIERSGVHFEVHQRSAELLSGGDPVRIDDDSEEGRELRLRIHEHYQEHDGENKDTGIEMDYRYNSRVIVPNAGGKEPEWSPSRYTPSTWPGARPPHVFLKNGTPMFDTFGHDWTLLTFSDAPQGYRYILDAAAYASVPLIHVSLADEELAQKLYEKDMILIRPDEHVAWRGAEVRNEEEAARIIGIVIGKERDQKAQVEDLSKTPATAFTGTSELPTQTSDFQMEQMGGFQR